MARSIDQKFPFFPLFVLILGIFTLASSLARMFFAFLAAIGVVPPGPNFSFLSNLTMLGIGLACFLLARKKEWL